MVTQSCPNYYAVIALLREKLNFNQSFYFSTLKLSKDYALQCPGELPGVLDAGLHTGVLGRPGQHPVEPHRVKG